MNTPKVNISIKTQLKRDRMLSMVMVAKEQQRISEQRFRLYKETYADKLKIYLDWCKVENVPSFIEEEVLPLGQ
jgi:hypothetical protein